jgi:CelD/BcsL family acetyltransferase involved in cellulose biosynthesis
VAELTAAPFVGPLETLRAAWDQLLDADHPSAIFRGRPWIEAWLAHRARGARPRLWVARRGDGPIEALLPLYETRSRLGARRLRLAGDDVVGSDFLGMVCRPEVADEAAERFAEALAPAELQLDGLLEHDPLTRALVRRGARATPRFVCPYIDTARHPYEAWLSQLPEGLGTQLRRRRRWLERRPGFAIERLEQRADVARGLEVLFALHHERWALEGGSDAYTHPSVEQFHRAAAQAWSTTGRVRLYLLHVDGAPRAALEAFRTGRHLLFYQAGHEVAWRPRSVGAVLLAQAIEDATTERLERFHLLRGEEAYKLRYATGVDRLVRIDQVGSSLGAQLGRASERLETQTRRLVRRVLPPRIAGRLDALRRRLAWSQGGA